MSSYNGRRAPNFSQYLEDLNAIPSPFEQSAQQSDFNIDAELALFTNAEFYDFGHFGDLNMPPVSYESSETKTEHQGPTSMDKQQNVDYVDFFNGEYGLMFAASTLHLALSRGTRRPVDFRGFFMCVCGFIDQCLPLLLFAVGFNISCMVAALLLDLQLGPSS